MYAFATYVDTGFFRMSSGYNSGTLSYPGRGNMGNCCAAPGLAGVLELYHEDILRYPIEFSVHLFCITGQCFKGPIGPL